MRLAFVQQDPGIKPGSEKGAAVHVARLCEALVEEGVEVVRVEHPDDEHVRSRLADAGPLDAIYERFSLRTGAAAAWAAERGLAYGLEVNSPLDVEENRYRGGSVGVEDVAPFRAAFEQASLVSVVSKPLVPYVLGHGARSTAVQVHTNGVDPSVFHPLQDREEARRELDLGPEQLALVFHGRLRPWHDLPLLVRAVADARDRGADLVLVCVGTGDFQETCAAALPPEAFRVRGWCGPSEVARHVGACDLIALAHSSHEAAWFSPLKLREAMAMGLVPIVPDLGDLAEAVLGGEAGLVYEAGRQDLLASALVDLALDAPRRDQLAERACDEAARHTWRRTARDVLHHLGLTAGSGGSG